MSAMGNREWSILGNLNIQHWQFAFTKLNRINVVQECESSSGRSEGKESLIVVLKLETKTIITIGLLKRPDGFYDKNHLFKNPIS